LTTHTGCSATQRELGIEFPGAASYSYRRSAG
jgi:hypothetical protein